MTGIVFVNPPLPIQDRYGLKSQGGAETPPLGLACLAAMTRKCGYDTAVIDAAATNMSYEQITREILEHGCKYVNYCGHPSFRKECGARGGADKSC